MTKHDTFDIREYVTLLEAFFKSGDGRRARNWAWKTQLVLVQQVIGY